MIRRTFVLERRFRRDGNGITTWQVEVYRWQIFCVTVWKTETLH